jgi:hypothetical protein
LQLTAVKPAEETGLDDYFVLWRSASGHWFAAALHLKWLLVDRPDDGQLLQRYEHSTSMLARLEADREGDQHGPTDSAR